jgi:glycerol-3-phosphate acyltransferase PlsY
MWTAFSVLLVGGYLLASIPFGLIIAQRVVRLDITHAGSGNIGATNVAREVGVKWGALTLLADSLKGFVPVVLAHYFLDPSAEIHETLKGMVGLSAVLGHQFPVYRRLRGGKGTATCLGVFLAISPVSCLYSGIIFTILVVLWRYVSLGSIVAALTMPLWLYFAGHSASVIGLGVVMAALITFQHRGNIQRLIRGDERKWQKTG